MDEKTAINSIKSYLKNGARFASFMYKNKQGEISIVTLLLGVNITNAYKHDLKEAIRFEAKDEVELLAKQEIIKSLENSIENHAKGKTNNNYKLKNLYKNLGKGIKINKETNKILISGVLINKQIIVHGDYKQVKHSAKTLAKFRISEKFKSKVYRNFILDSECISGIKYNGEILEFHNDF